ncbi:MAG: hypothetical protein U1F76_10185 [Candidatus Competibacteraceae bacterium]
MTAVSQSLLIYGLAILLSLLVAVLIQGIVAVAGWLQRRPTETVGTRVALDDATAGHDIVVIAAAVSAMVGTHRIVHIEDVSRGRIWTASGRAAHYASHRLPRHKH